MKDSIFITVLVLIGVCGVGCSPNPSISAQNEKRYQEYKRDFHKKFIDHFPSTRILSAASTSIMSSMNDKKMISV